MVLRRGSLSFIIIISLGIYLLLSITLFFVWSAKHYRIKAEIASKYEVINGFAKRSKMPITKESVFFLTDEENKLKNIYSRLKLALASPLNEEISEEELEPLQFKERLIQIQKKLREDAKRHNLSLPESLGFTKYETELSEPFKIPDLIKRLKILEELIHAMTLSGIDSLDEIRFINEEVKKDKKVKAQRPKKKIAKKTQKEALKTDVAAKEGPAVYYDIPVSFKIGCTSSKLIGFLYKLRLSPFVFVIDDLDIETTQASYDKDEVVVRRLKASFSIRAIAIN